MFKLDLEEAEEPEIKLPTSLDHQKSKRVPEKHLLLPIDYVKAFDCVDHNKLWKILEAVGKPDHITWLLRNLHASQDATEPAMEQQSGSKLFKECVRLYIVILLI